MVVAAGGDQQASEAQGAASDLITVKRRTLPPTRSPLTQRESSSGHGSGGFVARVRRNWKIPEEHAAAKGCAIITFNVRKDGQNHGGNDQTSIIGCHFDRAGA
jgi:hypothetical protein